MKRFTTMALALAVATGAYADANVQQKTKVQFTGVIGGAFNMFGGKAAREGVTSTVAIKGDRMLTVNDRSGELVDLSEEKVYRLDMAKKTYSVVTFAELRKQYEDAMKEAASESDSGSKDKKKNEGPEYEVDFDVKETGAKEKIGDWDTRQVILTVTVREKGKKLEQSGGAVMKADMWMGPKMAAMREVTDFNQRYYKQLYGDPALQMQQLALLMASTPTLGKAMKEMNKHRAALDGEAVRTTLTFETVASPQQKKEQQEEEAEGGIVGGLLRNAMKKRAESRGDAPQAPGRSKLFESTTEVLAANSNAGDVGIPAGFKQK